MGEEKEVSWKDEEPKTGSKAALITTPPPEPKSCSVATPTPPEKATPSHGGDSKRFKFSLVKFFLHLLI